jgi:hypothetical protein
MLKFGRDILLMQLGGLLCSASPIILVTKILGLEVAAVFSIGTKALTMGQQILNRIVESAAPGLTEIFVRGDRNRFILRFYQMSAFSIATATILATALMGANRTFVFFWTHGRVEWSQTANMFLTFLLVSTTGTRCFQGAFGMAADFSKIKWLPLVEGALFLGVSLFCITTLSLNKLLLIALACQVLASLFPSAAQAFFTFPNDSFWKESCPRIAGVLALITFAGVSMGSSLESVYSIFAFTVATVIGATFLLLCGLKNQFKDVAA